MCPYCGQEHDRHEDAACGCSCGANPMGCSVCMMDGGPPHRYDENGRKISPYTLTEMQEFYDDY